MPARLTRIAVLLAAAVVIAAIPLAGSGGPLADAVPNDGRSHQVFHPGSFEEGVLDTSRPVPICLGVPEDPPDCYDGELLDVQVSYIGRDASEPTVALDDKGTAYIAAAAYDGMLGLPRTMIMRSLDGGVTWSLADPRLPVGNETNPPATVDPWVQVDPKTGRVFKLDLTLACSYLSFSDDRGATWITNPLACGQPINDHQTIVAAPPPPGVPSPAYPSFLYYCFNRVTDSSCSRSVDGGLTWHPTGSPAYIGYRQGSSFNQFGVPGLCGGLHGHVKADTAGRIFIPRAYCGEPYLAVSEDAGTTWRQTLVDDELDAAVAHVAEHTSVAADDAGNVYYLFRDATRRLPWLAVSRDHGRTFEEPMLVAPPGVVDTNFATITAGERGRVAIQFPGSTAPQGSSFRPWNSYMVVTEDALAEDPLFVSVTANPVSDPIHRGNCNGRCALMLDFLDIDTSPVDGGFWAAVVDTCTAVNKCSTQNQVANDGEGVVVRQVGGPRLRTAETLPAAGP